MNLSTEQQIALGLLRVAGVPNPESIIEADRPFAALVGSYLKQPLRQMAEVIVRIVALLNERESA